MPLAQPLDEPKVPPYLDTPMGQRWLEDVYGDVIDTCPSTISLEEEGVDPTLVDKETGQQWNRRVEILSGQGLSTLVAMEKRLKALRSEVREDSQWDFEDLEEEDLEEETPLFETKHKLARHRHVITKSIVDLYAIFGAVLRWEDLKGFIGAGE
jgi:hypothetical protein